LSNGTGVAGQGGTGVYGFSSPTSGFARATVGVLNTNAAGSAAVYGIGQSFSGQTFGVEGYNFSNTNFAAGVSGVADGDQNTTFGVIGTSLSQNGIGTLGFGVNQSKTGGIIGCCPVGVWGDTGINSSGAAGVVATADDSKAFFAANNSPTGFPTGAFLSEGAASALVAGGFSQSCSFDNNGDLFCQGSKSAVVPVDDSRRQVALYAVESPQNWFEDFGSGRLESGVGRITLEATFAQTVNTGSDYHVFLTPDGDCQGLYISSKSATGFEVHELGGGRSDVRFDYRIVALRRGYEAVRLADKTAMVTKLKDSLPKPTATPAQRWTPPVRPKPFTATANSANYADVVPAKLASGPSPH